jgi:hypothetical protein
VHGELLIFAERSVDVQSETIQPDEVRRKPAGHLIEVEWTRQRAGNAMHKSWDNCKLHCDVWLVNPGSHTDKRRNPSYSYAILEIVNRRATPTLHYYRDKYADP